MQEEILEYLKKEYVPDAIILHGSRARGMEREHSDWDFLLLHNDEPKAQNGREVFKDQNIELFVETLPVEDIEGLLAKLQGAQVLYESGGEGTQLLLRAEEELAKGVHWPPEQIDSHQLWVEGRVNGMKDNVDRPVVFYKYFSDLYQRVFNYWYWIKQKAHSQPVYIAIEEVARQDPDYFALVERLTDSSASLDEKAAAAESIKDHLFS